MADLMKRLEAKFREHRFASEEYAIENILAELDAAGYAIVPKEPSIEMAAAGSDFTDRPRSTFRAMLAAAPKVTEVKPEPPLFETRQVGEGSVTLHKAFRK